MSSVTICHCARIDNLNLTESEILRQLSFNTINVINGDQQYVLLHRTGCDNITSFFEMRAVQTVGVVMGREWSYSEAVVLKICSLSLSAAIKRWKSGKPAFAVEVYFSN
jgi:hypothetical protein